ncbi:hypothetical protein A3C91_03345 [Candidatus Azambacteria bacterium RIFCSPHIGHO2_02_FULL_52_12]|uniref:dolichyl-phosphate beta-glucosyltransferase n=1 Tax=Candidatus Azambacteria bacterium RIFCSPLOWO2_01_FULL_46_25 TaxID=1797298 RepID=A0A1F5BUD5_9BACT|nr:MAG: hypothetical protein A3C91_03345 [Candidatus Azambacteria bacterium RIFCSPHIGHO2_02_FULL_52_12]OGD34221.1 MAG: hypothetical protein A2988_01410 [Candidatus Azambacteria bacterium RIFCSPLOWO2_01_FULL_46_25]OGD36759.1 MAG: hypothetical protein A2850_00365 [Candidatus Azambacteria bacterium RIFCSPHIGHO2_01_FULL_51_74]
MQREIFLSVVIPAYKEEHRIGATLEALDSYLRKQTFPYEILVVNDGSTDGTAVAVRRYEQKVKGLRLIDNKENHGKGFVVRQGMLAAQGKYRLFMDADNSVSIEYFSRFLPYFSQGYDVIIASLEVPGAQVHEKGGWYRRFFGHYSKYLIRALTVWEVRDSQRGFKVFSEKAAQDIFPLQTLTGWGFDFEVLMLAKKLGYKIKELPVEWNNAGESKVNAKAYLTTLGDLLHVKKNMVLGRYERQQRKT